MKSVYTGGEKVAEFESYDELRVGDSKPAFIYEGNELVYPNPVKDGLVLWYDFSGRTNADGQRGIAEDLSVNGNHGTLQNFNYSAESGYDKNKLLFDGVDDYLQVPETGLNPESMTAQINDNIYSYNNERVFSMKDSVVSCGINLFKLTNLVSTSNSIIQKDIVNGIIEATNTSYYIADNNVELKPEIEYRISVENVQNSSSSRKDRVSVQVNDKRNSSVLISLGHLSESNNELTFSVTQEQYDSNDGKFSIALYVSGAERVNARIEKVMLVENKEPRHWNLPTEDSLQLISTVNKQTIQSYKLYNRPLTAEEIEHNYAIEKERFGIE